MFWDGLFHAFTWIMTVAGLALLWRAVKRPDALLSGKTFGASLLLGWGAFNLVEGVIDHGILQVHHVVENGNHLLWDMLFLASGILLSLVGGLVIRRDRNAS